MIGTVIFVSGFAAVVMLVGVLFSRLFPMRNFRRVYLFGAAAAGLVCIVALSVLGVQSVLD